MSEQGNKVEVTVFTATYNRAELLPRLFNSLLNQTYNEFEWVIVDDGSIDNTAAVVSDFKKRSWFKIIYVKQENQGRHMAINTGVIHANGRFFSIIDSDDMFETSGLEDMVSAWNAIPESDRPKYSGVCGLLSYEDGGIVGDKFPTDNYDSDDVSLRLIDEIGGDKISLIRTEVMREFPYPDDLGRYAVCSLVWNRIGFNYKCRYINKVIGIVEYQEGGLTDTALKMRVENPKSMRLINRELLESKLALPLKQRIKCAINYARYSMHENLPVMQIIEEAPHGSFIVPLIIPAWVLSVRDKYRLRSEA